MYEYIIGRLVAVNPAEAVIETGGFGYRIYITVNTFSHLQKSSGETVKMYLYHQVREDDESFFGFADTREREAFLLLISVSGVGPAAARMILSSMTVDELRNAILTENAARIKSVKGIGLKTAQRIIVDLKDKLAKGGASDVLAGFEVRSNSAEREEAAVALVSLGFAKPAVEKALDHILAEKPGETVENLIKKALKIL